MLTYLRLAAAASSSGEAEVCSSTSIYIVVVKHIVVKYSSPMQTVCWQTRATIYTHIYSRARPPVSGAPPFYTKMILSVVQFFFFRELSKINRKKISSGATSL